MVAADAVPEPTRLYSKLSAEQQADFSKAVIDKLKTLIGGYGELSVLAEYIAVMLQSSRPPEQIQSELEAFLQEQSQPFTEWLCKQLAKQAGHVSGPPADAKGEALLLRAVQDARQGAAGAESSAAAAAGGGRSRRKDAAAAAGEQRERRTKEKDRKHSSAAAAAAAAVAVANVGASAGKRHHRSRSRRRRRDREAATSRRRDSAVLTPNVRFLRDAYHQKNFNGREEPPRQVAETPALGILPAPAATSPFGLGVPPDTRWSFRADPAPPAGVSPFSWQAEPSSSGATAAAAAAPHHAPQQPGPGGATSPFASPPPVVGGGYGQLGLAEPSAPPMTHLRFTPKKWKVARANTVVRATEHLNSDEVQTLQEGEIVEQVAPSFKLKNGIVRVQIRHPSSPQFPNPIGWVTLDATAAGGPKFLEPGPEPMQKPHWRPPPAASTWPPQPAAAWRPRAPFSGSPRAPSASQKMGPYGFQNLIWTPGSAKGTASSPIRV